MKKIWIINHYAAPPSMTSGVRHYQFAKNLIENGYNVTVFAANRIHNTDIVMDTGNGLYTRKCDAGIPFVFVKTCNYKGNGFFRINNMISFFVNMKRVSKQYSKKWGRPDIIYASSVHPLAIVAGIQLAKRFGIKCIGEVRDLWPESIVEYSSRFTKNNLIIKMLYLGERWIYKKCDCLIFTMEGGYDYIAEKGWERDVPKEKVFYINNGVDLKEFDSNSKCFQLEDKDLDNPDIFKVVYAGSIRPANDVGTLIDAAKFLQEKGSDSKMLIYGDGIEKSLLMQRLINEKITNVVFKGRVAKNEIPYILSKSDLNILNYQKHDIWRYGGSQNKLFEYFASGKPVLSTIEMGYDLITKYSAGKALKCNDAISIAEAIDEFAILPEDKYNLYCKNARTAAEQYDFKILTDQLIRVIDSL